MSHIPLRALGKTSLTTSRLGLGLAALGRPGYINLGHGRDLSGRYAPVDLQDHAHQILDEAWEAGVRYFDVARSYGRGEEFLGTWLQDRKPLHGSLAIGSKWGYTYTAGWQVKALTHEVKEHTLPVLHRQWKESVLNLGQYIGLYQIHSATLESGVLERLEVLQELAKLRNEGTYIGLSLSGAQQNQTLEKALDIQVDGLPLFSVVQATWNILEPSIGPLLAHAHNSGTGIIVKETLANGRLTSRNVHPAFAPIRKHLEQEAALLDTSLEAFCLAAVLSQPWADVVLSGAATSDQLHNNISSLQVPPRLLDWDYLHSIAESPEEYWQKRSELPWN